jgi:hypothetical protein
MPCLPVVLLAALRLRVVGPILLLAVAGLTAASLVLVGRIAESSADADHDLDFLYGIVKYEKRSPPSSSPNRQPAHAKP